MTSSNQNIKDKLAALKTADASEATILPEVKASETVSPDNVHEQVQQGIHDDPMPTQEQVNALADAIVDKVEELKEKATPDKLFNVFYNSLASCKPSMILLHCLFKPVYSTLKSSVSKSNVLSFLIGCKLGNN